MCSVAVAETYEKGSIEQVSDYTEPLKNPDATYKYESIKSPNVRLTAVRKDTTCNIEVGSIDAGEGRVQVTTYIGNIALGDVKAGYINVSTQSGDIKLTGEINATDPGSSTIDIALQDENASGNIILDGASISGVAMGIHYHPLDGIEPSGQILISGETTLTDVHLSSDLVNVKEGAKLTLENVSFTNRTSTDANAGLVLSDNVALTLSGEQPLKIGSLTLGDGAVITLEISDLSGKMPSLTLDGTKEGDAVFQLLFTSEALAQMNEGMELDIDAMLKDVDTDILADDTTVMLTLADDVHANVKDIFSATSYTTGSGSSITVVGTIAVPEPTTATLSLLALAGLCARRRRASL